MAEEYLAGKIDAQAAVLEASLGDAALKDSAFSAASPAQLVGATTAGILLIGLALTAIATADGSKPAGEAVAPAIGLARAVLLAGFGDHNYVIGRQESYAVCWRRAG